MNKLVSLSPDPMAEHSARKGTADLLKGLAVIFMIQVHITVTTGQKLGQLPTSVPFLRGPGPGPTSPCFLGWPMY